ncbi:MAG TPA: hypothetical protein DDY52_01505 [Candidatus Moranbacteria bacterium]|nr:MAG: hypothetical protein UR51_C0010G0029 [Candidatus Moranbacteria bacterium GW2011_GWF1_34_10]HBI16819.1 hypothetical protein [Candidatus Moranbacteria bacterium]
MERLTGVSGNIRVGKGVAPVCFNGGVGEGNCLGMIKHGTCPALRSDSKRGKFPECQDFIDKRLDKPNQHNSEN